MPNDVMDSPTGENLEGIQNDSTNTQNPQGQAEMVTKEEYLNAQSFGTKARQNEIAMATKLAQKDSKELHAIEDSKVKDAVTKQLLGMSYAEASAVLGANFDITASNEDNSGDDAPNSEVIKKIKLLEFKEAQREKDAAIAKFESENPNIFGGDAAGMREKIEKELEYISTSLPIEERVRRAAATSLGNPMDTQSLAYSLLLNGTANNPKGVANPQEQAKTKVETIQDELRVLFKLPFPKKK